MTSATMAITTENNSNIYPPGRPLSHAIWQSPESAFS